jgi:hypothetical protein
MGAAVIGTAVGLYVVVNQDTDHGAEHHPLGDPHGEGGAKKTGTESTVSEDKEEEPKEEPKQESKEAPKKEPKKESKDEVKEEPKSDHQDPSKATKENSEEKDKQSPDESDKVGEIRADEKTVHANICRPTLAKRKPRAPMRLLASRRACPTTIPNTLRISPSTPRRARRARVWLKPRSCKEPYRLSVLVQRTRSSAVTPKSTRMHRLDVSSYSSHLEC